MTKTLPEKMSDLIRVALKDMALCEADPCYAIHMMDWHTPSKGVCKVCLAGAVMAKTLEVSVEGRFVPSYFKETPDNRHKLYALNDLRIGDVEGAMRSMHLPEWDDYLHLDREIVPFQDNADLFYNQMFELAQDLEEAGL